MTSLSQAASQAARRRFVTVWCVTAHCTFSLVRSELRTRQPAMSRLAVLLVALVASCPIAVSQSEEESEREYAELWRRTIESMTSPPESYSIQALTCEGIQFADGGICNLTPPPPATSAHLLTPFDIGIVGAIGDSITAAFGAKAESVFGVLTEARGVSWSIGGDKGDYTECATIPNILQHFNPDVYGASTGDGLFAHWNLNRAVSGAKSPGIMKQAETLVEMIKNVKDQENKWKLVTLWIGGNDLCQSCENDDFLPEKYFERIYETVKYLKDNLSKTLVSVPLILDVTKLGETTTLVCGAVHLFACNCAMGDKIPDTRVRAREYMELLKTLDYSDLNDGNDFAVVVQPFFEELTIPYKEDGKVDMSFFALDCFHMNTRGHMAFAAALWNNMIAADKTKDWVPYDPVLNCPNEAHPYFYTSQTKSLLEAMQAENGGLNAESLPNSDNDQSEGHGDSGWSLGEISGVAVGVVASVSLVVVLVGVAIAGIVWARKNRRHGNSEAIPLVKKL